MITKVKGTHDYTDLHLYNFIVERAKKYLQLYNFSEIATPIIEPLSLFVRSLGEHTDVVSKEMFIIQSRDEKKEQICLRPEMTAPTMRAYLENNITQSPWQVFACGPLFRYERPQKGRLRQFHQINIESINATSIVYDVQMIVLLDRFFHEALHMINYVLHLNFLGCSTDRSAYHTLLDIFIAKQDQNQLCDTCKHRIKTNLLRIFDCKNSNCQKIYQSAPQMIDHLCVECDTEWQELQKNLDLLSVSYIYNKNLVRGLDYYNKTVFEFTSDALGAQSAFCGGGRYNQLATQLGAKQDVASVGAAIGIERLMLLLENNTQLTIAQKPALSVIIPFEKEQESLALLIADELHVHNICTMILADGALKGRMKKANTLGATNVLLIGKDEQEKNCVTVKQMQTGTQQIIKITELKNYLK